MENNKVTVVFRICGSAADIASLAPALVGVEGELMTRPEKVPPEASHEAWWGTELQQRNVETIEPAIVEALDRIESIYAVVLQTSREAPLQIELDCHIEIKVDRPLIELSTQSLRRLAALQTRLAFEVFDYRE